MRIWFAGPRIGFFRPGVSFNVGGGQRRAPQPGPHGGDFVYVVKGEHGHVKIGVSTDPAERLRTLQTGCSFPLALSWFSPVAGDAYAVEQEAHAMLAAHRLSGEWFDIQPEGAIGAVYGAAYRLGIPLDNDQTAAKRFPFWPYTIVLSALFGVLMAYDMGGIAWPIYLIGTAYGIFRNNTQSS